MTEPKLRRADDNYSKREIDAIVEAQKVTHNEIRDKAKEDHTEVMGVLGKVLTQTTEHNHRMTKVELWKATATGAYIASSAFMGIVVLPILGWAVWTLVNLPERINQSVEEALTAYEVQE